jgi:hypothetical protein
MNDFLLTCSEYVEKRAEKRVNIKFIVKLKETTKETFNLLCEAYAKDVELIAHVFEWHKRLSGEEKKVEDDERSGRPVALKTGEHIGMARTVFLSPHCATAPGEPGPLHYRGFMSTLRHTTRGRTPLEE